MGCMIRGAPDEMTATASVLPKAADELSTAGTPPLGGER